MVARIVGARGLRKGGERRGFADVHVPCGLPEVHLRRGLDPGDVGPQVDLIEVQLENGVLREIALQLYRDARFAQLARQLLFPPEVLGEHVARELHRDGREALGVVQRRDIGLERSQDPPVVDAVMLVEALVLDRDERLPHEDRNLFERQHGAPLDAQLGDQAAVRGIHFRRLNLDIVPRGGVDARDARAALRRAHARPRAIGQAAHVQQRQHRRDDHAAALDRIVPPAHQKRAARSGDGGARGDGGRRKGF